MFVNKNYTYYKIIKTNFHYSNNWFGVPKGVLMVNNFIVVRPKNRTHAEALPLLKKNDKVEFGLLEHITLWS